MDWNRHPGLFCSSSEHLWGFEAHAHAIPTSKWRDECQPTNKDMSHGMTKPTKWRLRIRPVWAESSLCTQWVAKDQRFLHADSEDSNQTGHPPSLIRVFAGRTLTVLVLSCHGSYIMKFWMAAICEVLVVLLGFRLWPVSYNSYYHAVADSSLIGPRQANLVLIAYASSDGSGEPAHSRSLARTFAARSYKQWVKRNFQTESQIPGPSEWLGMRS